MVWAFGAGHLTFMMTIYSILRIKSFSANLEKKQQHSNFKDTSTKILPPSHDKNTSSTWAPRSVKLVDYTATPIKMSDSSEDCSHIQRGQ